MTFKRTTFLAGAMALLATTATAAEDVEVFSTSGCGCCIGWIKHLEKAGFEVSNENLALTDLYARKMDAGLKGEHVSCHTGFVGGYVVEGHVPASEVKRLVSEKPDAVGIAVPGMPAGSPGMGTGDEPYEVLLVGRDGTSTVFARYPR